MNIISKFSKIAKNVKIGNNNWIGDNVKIYENVIIGNNNKIYDNSTIYPNTKIGNNNVFLNNNNIGEFGINSSENFTEKKFNGLEIGDNNYFHIDNVIFNGYHEKTIIGNNNKILGESHIGHDCIIDENVHIYPRTLISGFCRFLSYSGTGVGTYIRQRTVIGNYSFTALGSSIVKNTFPFFIIIDNKPVRLNFHRIPKEWHIYEKEIIKIQNDKEFNINVPEEIKNIIKNYLIISNK